ncbi:MAG: hypothetical protein Hens2KO_12350 [Henriciella sp.]
MRFLKAIFALILVVAILGGAAIGFGWFWLQGEVAKPGPLGQETEFTIERGEGLASVANRLETLGLVADKRILRVHARLEDVESALKAGSYIVPARASVSDIMKQFVDGEVIEFRLTIPEGLTTAQILRRVEAATDLTGDMPEQAYEEGVLLPDTYVFGAGTTRTQFIERMEAAQDALLDDLWESRQDDLPVSTPYEAVILASVVEKKPLTQTSVRWSRAICRPSAPRDASRERSDDHLRRVTRRTAV